MQLRCLCVSLCASVCVCSPLPPSLSLCVRVRVFCRTVVIIGNTPCSAVSKANGLHCNTFTAAEEETVMALWSLWSAPILMSNDLPNIPVRAAWRLPTCLPCVYVYVSVCLPAYVSVSL
eukprot:COSAG05_NODE_2719_length_2730_cov_3.003801_1_plen_119_part_00